jgi:hypothetical protein
MSAHGQPIALPAPTAWPLIAAFGIALLAAGLVTNVAVSLVGGVLLLAGAVGWFREVLPAEHHETVTAPAATVAAETATWRAALGTPDTTVPAPTRPVAPALQAGEHGHRARLPLEVYPVSAGVRGGLAGGVAMAALAALYGVLAHGSVWYPINLLAAAASAELTAASDATLAAFQPWAFAAAVVVHGIACLLVGLLYGVLLPLVPRRPILLGGVLAPLVWTGLLRATLDVVNPALDARIDWPWFVASQVAFGVVAGIVVARSERVRTLQHVPFALRAGIERGREPRA